MTTIVIDVLIYDILLCSTYIHTHTEYSWVSESPINNLVAVKGAARRGARAR